MKSSITILCLCFLATLPAFCADYYVSTAGSDSNPGTQAQPFATIQHAINVCPAPPTFSTVHLDASTWNESPTIGSKSVTLTGDYNGPNGMGGRTSSIIVGDIGMYEGLQWVEIVVMSLTARKINMSITTSATVNSCDIINSTSEGISYGVASTAIQVNIQNCLIAYCNGDGIKNPQPCYGINISNCIIHDCGGNGVNMQGFGGSTISYNTVYNCNENGLYLSNCNLFVHDNNVYNNTQCGIKFNNITPANIYNNTIHDNQSYGVYCTGSSCNPDLGGGSYNSPGNNTISGNGTYEVYNDSPNLIFAKYNYWDPLSEAEMAGHTYLEVDVTRIYDHWEDSVKGYINWDEPGFPTRVELKSLGEIRASFYSPSNSMGQAKKR